MSEIHPTAIIAPEANLPDDIEVGPFTVIGPQVTIGVGSSIGSHALIEGETYIGANAKIYSNTVIGTDPQDIKFAGEHSTVHIGDNATIREFVTINRGTVDREDTRIGDNVVLLAYAHVAHDCIVGDNCLLSNCGTLAGHVVIEDYVVIGGLAAVHQFGRVGAHAFIGGTLGVTRDVPPYLLVGSDPTRIVGLNTIGLKRRGFSSEVIGALKSAYRIYYREGLNTTQALQRIEEEVSGYPEVEHFVEFIRNSERGVLRDK
ncbi:MAG: acyl-ACP--UDP-N-acetylglucosamine O-acyltransferase [bacterium]|nr:acyl-ACP--UDP-N-acetylglucosamine O-acyltransferase [bacterium]